MDPQIESWLSKLTLEEKAALVAGHDFMNTNAVPRLGIPSLRTSDGPHGLRVQGENADNGVTGSKPATCFPTASCTANTWDPSLTQQMGVAMAEEARHYGIDVILGPGVNIKRNPRCGRNFEYFSEDPFLAGRLGAGEVQGIQSQSVGTSVKHFALNGAENHRFMGDSVADERAMREIYLRGFQYIVESAQPETLMAAYNKINGVYCCENNWLLNDVLRSDWGFKGLVMSDWGATHDRILGIKSGLDLEMPGDTDICRRWIVDAVKEGKLPQEDLDKAVANVLALVAKHQKKNPLPEVDWKAHHELAKMIALQGAVLLKNGGALPLQKEEKMLVVGELFEHMRYQGGGSSMINPRFCVSPKEAFDQESIAYEYVPGYHIDGPVDEALIKEAVSKARGYDKVVLFLGLTDRYEIEGVDRKDMSLPLCQLSLVEALSQLNKQLVVVLYGGSSVELPFYDDVNAILGMFLPGQNGGSATRDLLFGKANPSGRLSETWPLSYKDVPFGKDYSTTVQEIYKESIYVGYRYYLSANKEVRFPFGHGLSYTTFAYRNLEVSQTKDGITVHVDVTNTGGMKGIETVQVYVAAPKENTHKPLRELKGFARVELEPNQTKTVEVLIRKEDLRYWDIQQNRFVLENGIYAIQIGRNSRDIVLTQETEIQGETVAKTIQKPYEIMDFFSLGDEEYARLWNMKIPPVPPGLPITLESRLSDLKATFMGRILYNAMQGIPRKEMKKARKLPDGKEKDNRIKGAEFLEIILDSNSIVSLSMSSSGAFPYPFAEGFVELSNGHLFRGIKCFLKKVKAPTLPINQKEEN